MRSGCLHEQPEVLDLRTNHCAILGATLLERRHPKDRLQRCFRNHSDQQLWKGSPDLKGGQDGVMMDYDTLLGYDCFVLGEMATQKLRNGGLRKPPPFFGATSSAASLAPLSNSFQVTRLPSSSIRSSRATCQT